jgi:sulfite reductase alpha subunit-like flavoprotein
MITNGALSKLYTAFSRDGDGLKKVYVQQRVEESGEQV